MDVVDRIFDILEQKSIEQKQFASAVGVAPSKVTQWKTRSSMSYLKRISKIAEYLGVSVDFLINGDRERESTPTTDMPDILIKFNGLGPEDQEEVIAIIEMKAARKRKS